MRNAGLDEAQGKIKIVGRNINNVRYADDLTLMLESEEELRSLLRKVKEESEKAGLKLNIQKTNIMTSCAIQFQFQFSCSVMSNFLWFHELQHARPPCSSPSPGVHQNPCPLSWWCHPTILSSVVSFSSCPQSFTVSGPFQMIQLFASTGQSIGVSASKSVLPKNTQDWSPLGWTGWISLQFKGLSRVFSNTTVQKHHFLAFSFLYSPTLTSIHDYWKNHSFD